MAKRFEIPHLSCFCKDGIMFLYNYCIFVSNWISQYHLFYLVANLDATSEWIYSSWWFIKFVTNKQIWERRRTYYCPHWWECWLYKWWNFPPNHLSSSHISPHSPKVLVCHQRTFELSKHCFPAAFLSSCGSFWWLPRLSLAPSRTLPLPQRFPLRDGHEAASSESWDPQLSTVWLEYAPWILCCHFWEKLDKSPGTNIW